MQPNENCDHYETREFYEERVNDWTGETEGEWKARERSFIIDLDLHRYQCTRCKQIGYYSDAARAFYEEGLRTPGIEGLE